MSILFDSTRSVKPATTFGRGILASRPPYADPVTLADRQWAAANLNATATDYALPELTDRELEDGAEQAMWNDMMDRGFRPY